MWRASLAVAFVLLGIGACRTAEYNLDVLDALHDENYDLRREIAVSSPAERLVSNILGLFFARPEQPESEVVRNPPRLSQKSVLSLARRQPRDLAGYARSVATLAPISALGEDPLSRAYALDVMVFLHGEFDDPEAGRSTAEYDEEAVGRRLDELGEILSGLREEAADPDAVVRGRSILRALGDVQYPNWRDATAVLRLFATLARSSDALGGVELDRGIRRVASQAIQLALVSALSSRELPYVREEAAQGLGILGYPESVPRLTPVLQRDPEERVRGRAAQALGRIGDPVAVPELIDALALDEDPGVQWLASRALERITERSFGEDADRWRRYWREILEEGAG